MDASELMMMVLILTIQMVLVIGAAYGLTKTKWFREVVEDRLTPVNCLVLIATFGALSVAGTYLAADYQTSKVGMRDFPVLIAGFIGGPIVGLGAGLIGGLHRYSLGGVTALPCAISTILAGLVAGLVRLQFKGFPKPSVAIVTSFIMMVVHLTLAALISDPPEVGADIVSVVALPMIVFAVIGMTVFSLLYFKRLQPERSLKD